MPKKNTTTRILQFFIGLIFATIALVIILILAIPIGFYGMAMYLAPSLPSVKEMKTASLEMPLQIYSQDDKLIGQYGNRLSLPVTYEQIPKELIHAFLAAEDDSFLQHNGISVKGLGRAIKEVITDDEGQTGGSTITMQVAKNYFLSPERTINRKLTELFLARKIEDELTKNEILTLYVNKIYLGEGAYGIQAAAKKYYSKSLESLTIAEMAMLAGLPKAPSKYNPVANPTRALERRNWIIGRMFDLGYITKTQYDEAINAPIGLHIYQEKLDVNMPYLAEMTRYALVNRYGKDVINSGWRVKLTVDSQVQAEAEAAVINGLIAYDRRHGWRGAEANGEPLENFQRYGNMYPAKVTKVSYRSFEALLPSGKKVTVPWSGMSWAHKYYSANRVGGYPSSASQIVKLNDIVRLTPSDKTNGWRLTQVPKVQGSLVSLDPDTGLLKALVGGFDFNHSKFNRATQGWRQPGSTIKPLIYTTALEKGYTPDSMVSDSPIRVGNWRPKNADGRFYGSMPLRRGLYLSRNLVSIHLLRSVGIPDARNLLDQFGLDKEKMPTTLSLALGSGTATPLQMATAYSTFANGGHRIQPYFISQIYDYNNQLLFQANPQQACAICFNDRLENTNKNLLKSYKKQNKQQSKEVEQHDEATLEKDKNTVDTQNIQYNADPSTDRLKAPVTQYVTATQAPRIISAKSAYEMADILHDVVQRGTAVKAKALGRSDIGGKTGTTNDSKDAWFAGFHPTVVTVVWVGFDQPSTLGRREYGGVAALPIWMNFMRSQLKDTPTQWVSLNNRAKSKKQRQTVMEVTDDGVVTIEDANDKKNESDKTSTNTHLSKPQTRQRPAPKPEPKPKPINDSLPPPSNPLSQSQPRRPAQPATQPQQPPVSHSMQPVYNSPPPIPTQPMNTQQPQISQQKPLNVIPVDEMPPMPNSAPPQ